MVGGRPSKYDWDDKKNICYKLYVEEKKSPQEIYFASHFGVDESEIPSARLFRRQFNEKWNFPKRREHLSAEAEATLQARIKQLWEENLSVKDIRSTLEDEGFEFGNREFQRLRTRNGFRRREGNGFKLQPPTTSSGKRKRNSADVDGEVTVTVDTAVASQAQDGLVDTTVHGNVTQEPGISADEAARREQRLAQLQAESEEQLQSRKRRRRIRGYGHMPADEPGLPPRYASETSLDECKAFLHLSNDMYQAIRRDYEDICTEAGIIRKKGSLKDGRWQAAKDRLVRENMHLSAMMHPLQPDLDNKANALDCICMDITKRMRAGPKVITIAEANNILGLNPAASKLIRRVFYEILEADQFTTKLACGDEHFQELRDRWAASSPTLQQILAEGDPTKLKCVDKLCRDAQKRYNDDRIRADPTRANWMQKFYGPGPGPAHLRKPGTEKPPATKKPSKKAAKETVSVSTDTTLDPALTNAYAEPIPAYFRLAPASHIIGNHPRMWLGTIEAPTVASMHRAATSKAGAATVAKAQGVLKLEDGSENCYQIDVDEELQVYLEAAGAQDKATFVVQLEGGYA